MTYRSIRTIFFDLGGVLIGYDSGHTLREIANRSPLPPEELLAPFLGPEPCFVDFELGRVDTNTFFEELKALTHFDGPATQLLEIFTQSFSPIAENVALLHALKDGHTLATLSNTTPAQIDFIRENFDFLHLFDLEINSYEVAARKPDRAIYDQALARTCAAPAEALLIDDREENITAARELGWHVIHLHSHAELKAELERFDLAAAAPGHNPNP